MLKAKKISNRIRTHLPNTVLPITREVEKLCHKILMFISLDSTPGKQGISKNRSFDYGHGNKNIPNLFVTVITQSFFGSIVVDQ